MEKFPKLDYKKLKTNSLKDRISLVDKQSFAQPLKVGAKMSDFFKSLPKILAAKDLDEAALRVALAIKNNKTIIMAIGGHVIKVGLAPLIIDLMERKCIDLLAANGSVMVHDSEVALVGSTSEDVAAGLGAGEFGVTTETAELINIAAILAYKKGLGLGESLALNLSKSKDTKYGEDSLFFQAHKLSVPFTVHLAIGTDVYNIHPSADGAALGAASQTDFNTFCSAVATLEDGVFINVGSAVIIPEVFLKAVTLVRNLGYSLKNITTINMDFIRHYRPQTNVVNRPTLESGKGFYFIGHHEIMLPLLWSLILEKLERL